MKKNYNYPKTEEVLLNSCSIMGTDSTSPTTEPSPMVDPTPGGWAPKRQV